MSASALKLKIRHVKRKGDTKLDISGMWLDEIPDDVFGLTQLESLNLSDNDITDLGKIASLQNLKDLNAKDTKLTSLPAEIRDLSKLSKLNLEGTAIKGLDNYVADGILEVKDLLDSYFGNSGGGTPISKKPLFLDSGTDNLNDVKFLRKKIAGLQLEITNLKAGGKGSTASSGIEEEKDWLGRSQTSFGARPTTASSQMRKVRELEDELKIERANNKKLLSEVDILQAEISKANILSSASGEEGTIGVIPGVMEIDYEELKLGDQIGQGGFSVIKNGIWRGTDIAVKIIFDPVITEDLLAEVRNEVEMLSILRHPKIVMLMGMSSKPPNLAIVFENMPKGWLFDILHTSTADLSLEMRLKMARDVAGVFDFLHKSGVVHRDLKSYNILLDDDLNIKLCDFGLCKFKADLNRGTMQFSGTPAYMAPELFQKKSYDEKVDVFAFGTLLWELVTREVPFDGLEPSDVKEKVLEEEDLKVPYGTDKKVATLIKDWRALDPNDRPDFEYIYGVLNQVVE